MFKGAARFATLKTASGGLAVSTAMLTAGGSVRTARLLLLVYISVAPLNLPDVAKRSLCQGPMGRLRAHRANLDKAETNPPTQGNLLTNWQIWRIHGIE